MLDRGDLKDWLNQSKRYDKLQELEDYIDSEIKMKALLGITTFTIELGRLKQKGKAPHYYKYWSMEELTEESAKMVRDEFLRRYKDFGFTVDIVRYTMGRDSGYIGAKFVDIHKVVE